MLRINTSVEVVGEKDSNEDKHAGTDVLFVAPVQPQMDVISRVNASVNSAATPPVTPW